MGSGRGLGVVLHAKDGEIAVTEPFDRSIVQVYMGDLELARSLDYLFVSLYREPVVLRGDKYAAS